MNTTRGRSSFHIGDRVRIDLGRHKLTGFVVEDRGPIGVGGRRLFQVEIPMEPDEPMMVELPEDEMEAVPAETAAPTIEKKQIMAYLAAGGLVSILRANMAGGRNQPRASLCPDNLGNVTHTFNPERGVIGGQIIPCRALEEDKIFTPKRDLVVSFVESFGLNRQEAERVVSEVGRAP